jgi:hypothetical protein
MRGPAKRLIGTLSLLVFGTTFVPALAYLLVSLHLRATYTGGDLRGVIEGEEPILAITTMLGVAIGILVFVEWSSGAHQWRRRLLTAAGLTVVTLVAAIVAWAVVVIPLALFFALGTYPGATGPDPWVFRIPTMLVVGAAAALGGRAMVGERLVPQSILVLAGLIAPTGLLFDAVLLSSRIAIGPLLGASFGLALVVALSWATLRKVRDRVWLASVILIYAITVPIAMNVPRDAIAASLAGQRADSVLATERDALLAAGGPPPVSCAGDPRGVGGFRAPKPSIFGSDPVWITRVSAPAKLRMRPDAAELTGLGSVLMDTTMKGDLYGSFGLFVAIVDRFPDPVVLRISDQSTGASLSVYTLKGNAGSLENGYRISVQFARLSHAGCYTVEATWPNGFWSVPLAAGQ